MEIFSLLEKADVLDLARELDAAKRMVGPAEKKSIAGGFSADRGMRY